MPESAEPTEWWNTVGLHTYAHPDHEVEDMGHPHFCVRHPESHEWFTLRDVAPAKFLDLWDDGLGETVVPCPGHHVDVALYGAGITADGFRLADAVEVQSGIWYGEDGKPMEPMTEHEIETLGRSTYANAEDEREAAWGVLSAERAAHDPAPAELADTMRQAVRAALTASYEPTGLILGHEDYRHIDATDKVARVPADDPYRRANQQRIADAYGIPGWMVGVEGAKAPLRLRARWAVRRIPRRLLTLLPLVTYHGPRETGEGWMNDQPAEPRVWMLGVHVGNYRIGTTPHDPWTCGDDECTEDHG